MSNNSEQDTYLNNVRGDMKTLEIEIDKLKSDLKEKQDKYNSLWLEENKIMFKLTGKTRCIGCKGFVLFDEKWGNPHAYVGTHGDTKYSCW